MKHILFVDDDAVTHKLVQHALEKDFNLISCYDLKNAYSVIESSQELSAVIVDRGLPDGDGLSLCFRLRQDPKHSAVPILFLSGAGSESDKVSAFFAGADDYVTKPFGLLELKARIMARLRTASLKINLGELEIDLDSHRVHHRPTKNIKDLSVSNSEIELTRTEFKILVTLAQDIDRVFHREQLLTKVWGDSCHVSDRVIDSHISHLRKKIIQAGVLVTSLRGEGYRLSLKRHQADSKAA